MFCRLRLRSPPTTAAKPGSQPFLGDIVIARGVARRQARDAGHSERTELRVLALHGLLHLLGYDHERDNGRMRRVERRLRRKGGLRRRADRAGGSPRMIPLSVFLLACAAVYLGSIEAAFSALMRLSLRLVAERSNRPGALSTYLDDPLLLFVPVRLLLGLVTGAATGLLARGIGIEGAQALPSLLIALAAFVLVFELLIPLRSRAAIRSARWSCCCRHSHRSRGRSVR